jgi:hypothetical protein
MRHRDSDEMDFILSLPGVEVVKVEAVTTLTIDRTGNPTLPEYPDNPNPSSNLSISKDKVRQNQNTVRKAVQSGCGIVRRFHIARIEI